MWQGLREEHLNIDSTEEITLNCTATGMAVVFTGDIAKYAGSVDHSEQDR